MKSDLTCPVEVVNVAVRREELSTKEEAPKGNEQGNSALENEQSEAVQTVR